jgi:hypothetical protein
MIQDMLFIMSEKEQAYGFNGYFLRSVAKKIIFCQRIQCVFITVITGLKRKK